MIYVWPFFGILGGLGAERWVECGWSWVDGGEIVGNVDFSLAIFLEFGRLSVLRGGLICGSSLGRGWVVE